jgi:hypothetical protein
MNLVQIAYVRFAFFSRCKPTIRSGCIKIPIHVALDRVFHFVVWIWSSKLFNDRREALCSLVTISPGGAQKWEPVGCSAFNITIVVATCTKHAFNHVKLWTTLASFLKMNERK